MNKHLIYGIITVIGAALIHHSFGYNYTIGNINPYLIAYMQISDGQAIWFHGIVLACQAISMPIGGLLASKLGFRIVTVLSIIGTSGGLFASYFTIKVNFGAFLTTYCIIYGLGFGLPYSVLFSVASAWFPKHRAVVVGIIASGLGLGALVFTPIQTALINPDNIADLNDPRVKENVPKAFLILGGITLAMQIIGLALCRENKMDQMGPAKAIETASKFSSKGSIDKENEIDISETHVDEVVNYTIKEAMKNVDFYLIWCIVFADAVSITFFTSTYKIFGRVGITDDLFLSRIATCTSIFNCTGRIIWGLICDKFSFKCPLGWLLAQWGLLLGTFPLLRYTSHMRILYPIWVFGIFFTMSGHFVLLPGATTRIFGPKNMATTYGLLYFATAPSSILSSLIASQFSLEGKWTEVFLGCMGCCILAFTLSVFLKDKNGNCIAVTNICSNVCNACRVEHVDEEEEYNKDFDALSSQF